jgi:hypothetical protein
LLVGFSFYDWGVGLKPIEIYYFISVGYPLPDGRKSPAKDNALNQQDILQMGYPLPSDLSDGL